MLRPSEKDMKWSILNLFYYCGVICLFFTSTAFCSGGVIDFKKNTKKLNIDLIQAIEARNGSRRFDGSKIPMDHLGLILWAGYGAVTESGRKNIYGVDGISGATSNNKLTVPSAWGKHYLRIFVLLPDMIWLR